MAKKQNPSESPSPAPDADNPYAKGSEPPLSRWKPEMEDSDIPEGMNEDTRGRPTLYTRAKAMFILEELADGGLLNRICVGARLVDPTFPAAPTVRLWVVEDRDGFSALYARARDLGADAMAEKGFDIVDDGSNDLMTIHKRDFSYEIEDREVTSRSKIRADYLKWYLAQIVPKRWGPKVEIITKPTIPQIAEDATPEEAAAAYLALIKSLKS